MTRLTAQAVADAIQVPLHEWPGNCYAIACAVLKSGMVRGRATYGHYYGYISPLSIPFGGRKWSRHGWITRRKTIVDPTRWVFEAVKPYIYVGPVNDADYDLSLIHI